MSLCVSLKLVQWATSSQFRAQFPALCAPPTAEPAWRDRVCVNVAAVFIELPAMPTLLPAQVSFVGLFVYAWLFGGLIGHLSFTQTVRTGMYSQNSSPFSTV